jgi:ABC-2 type transport system permease protein
MNTQSNAMAESFESSSVPPGTTPPAMSATRPFYWSLRRELWENRSLYIAPLAAGAAYLFGFLISTIHLPDRMRSLAALDPERQRQLIAQPYDFAAGMLMVTALIVAVFYSLDALHGERRDRSILFWKSLPVSDATTVLSKAAIAIAGLPLAAWAITMVLYAIMWLVSSIVLAGNDSNVATLWTRVSLFQMSLGLLYHLVTVHIIWHAPIYSWMILVSSWARRAAFLWAVLPFVAICFVEKIVFNTSYFANMLIYRMAGGSEALAMPGRMPIGPETHFTPVHYLVSPGLWIGLALTAVLLWAAVQVRRRQGPI